MKTVALGLILGGGCYFLWRYNNRVISVNLKPDFDECFEESTILTDQPYLPEEIMFNILSYLPVKSLLRFKCVCKHWNALTLDPQFIHLHYQRCSFVFYKKLTHSSNSGGGGSINNEEDDFVATSACAGLTLECTMPKPSSPLIRYRIRNLEMHQVIELPSPQNRSLDMGFQFFPSSRLFKLVSMHMGENKVIGFEVLVLGISNENTSNSSSWRPLVVPPNLHRNYSVVPGGMEIMRLVHIKGVAYWVWNISLESTCIQVDILDMENERYIGIMTCPKRFFSNTISHNYSILNWGGHLAVVEIVKEEELHVLVLEDYKSQKWAESKVIINLTCLKEEVKELKVFALGYAHGSELVYELRLGGNLSIGLVDFSTGRLTTLHSNCDKAEIFAYTRPSLSTVEGMKSYTQAINTKSDLCFDYFDMRLILSVFYK